MLPIFCLDALIAHRGLHDCDLFENTMPAFMAAINDGYAIETDIRLSRDKQIVISHDHDLKRMAGVEGDVKDFDYAYLKTLKLGNSNCAMPLLSDLLLAAEGKSTLIIEIKKASDTEDVNELEELTLQMLKGYKGKFAVQSFNYKSVDYFTTHAPHFVRGLLMHGGSLSNFSPVDLGVIQKMVTDTDKKIDFIDFEVSMKDCGFIKNRDKDMGLISWTARSQNQLQDLLTVADNVIFEGFVPQNKTKVR